jgi:hypothetical protein
MIGETYLAPVEVLQLLWDAPQTDIRYVDGKHWLVTAKPEQHALNEVFGLHLGQWLARF